MVYALLWLLVINHYKGFLANAWVANSLLMTGPKAYLTYARSVQTGTQHGLEECKHQFAWERWNCPDHAVQLRGMRSATRETSFVHAISAAGVMYTLTRNCSLGDLGNCGCDVSKNGQIGGRGWLWGGCSDNVDFGERISKQYVDAQETGQDSRAAVNLHNNEAGRKAVRATMRRICRCHGMSESCSVKTCWMQLSDFRDVGDYLKQKHARAHKLEPDQRRLRAANNADRRGAIADGHVAATELVFLEDSPDYCARNTTLGLRGTEGRECQNHQDQDQDQNQHSRRRRSCRRLCHDCGLRVEERRVEVAASCNCAFRWCCRVDCEDCSRVVVQHACAEREGGAHGHANAHAHRRRHRAPKEGT